MDNRIRNKLLTSDTGNDTQLWTEDREAGRGSAAGGCSGRALLELRRQ